METIAYIALGSNLGDRELNLLLAVAELGKLPGCRITALSPFYETAAVGMPQESPNFYNAVARLSVTTPPDQLLKQLKQIETVRFGRKPSTGLVESRAMDLDLLLYGSESLTTAELTIPHPRMFERRFVLQPLADIAPELIPPGCDRTVATLLSELDDDAALHRIE